MQNGNPVRIEDGHTGEVVAIANHEDIEDHASAEFELIIKGYLATLAAEEEELMAEEEIPPSGYPNNSMVVTMPSGEEVVIPLPKEQVEALMHAEWFTTTFIL